MLPAGSTTSSTMKTIRRFLHLPQGPPVKPRKAYCRYPGCGQPFEPDDALDQFCSRECLQDYNWNPPAPWYLPPEASHSKKQRLFKGWRLRDASGPAHIQPSSRWPNGPSAHPAALHRSNTTGRYGAHQDSRENIGSLGHRASRSAEDLLYTEAPVAKAQAPSTNLRSFNRPPAIPSHLRNKPLPAIQPSPAARPVALPREQHTNTHRARPSRQHGMIPIRLIPPGPSGPPPTGPLPDIPRFAGVDEQGWPKTVNPTVRRGQPTPIQAYQPAPGPANSYAAASGTSGGHNHQSSFPPTARHPPGAAIRRGPRPRSNSFGGFQFPGPR